MRRKKTTIKRCLDCGEEFELPWRDPALVAHAKEHDPKHWNGYEELTK